MSVRLHNEQINEAIRTVRRLIMNKHSQLTRLDSILDSRVPFRFNLDLAQQGQVLDREITDGTNRPGKRNDEKVQSRERRFIPFPIVRSALVRIILDESKCDTYRSGVTMNPVTGSSSR